MKTLVIAVAILGSGLFNTSSATGTLDINNELKKVVKFDKNQLQIEKNETAFVKVSFKINGVGEVEVLEVNYSDKKFGIPGSKLVILCGKKKHLAICFFLPIMLFFAKKQSLAKFLVNVFGNLRDVFFFQKIQVPDF